MISKFGFFLILLFVSYGSMGQRFTFAPEIGITCSQIDGDLLQGYDKRGTTFGLGTNYYVSDKFSLSFNTRYKKLGSSSSGRKQSKPSGSFQFTSAFSTASVGTGFMIMPFDSKLRIGGGVSYNRVLDFSFNTLVQLKIEDIIIVDEIQTNYLAYNINAQFNIFQNLYANISFYKSFNNLLDDSEISAVRTIVPYYFVYSIFYEIDPNPKRRHKKSKKKRRISN